MQLIAAEGPRVLQSHRVLRWVSPGHRVHRNITQSWFMPPNLRKFEADLATLAKEFVDRMESLGDSCDFVKDVAVWYPLQVVMMILGVPCWYGVLSARR
jgi:cytochrome P450